MSLGLKDTTKAHALFLRACWEASVAGRGWGAIIFHGQVASATFGSRSASELLNIFEPKMVESGDRKWEGSDLWIVPYVGATDCFMAC